MPIFDRIFGARDTPPAVPGYALECPRQDELRDSLSRVLGEQAQAVWREACASAGVGPYALLGIEQLQRVAAELERRDDLAGTVAGAFGIRLRSYLLLSRA